MSSNSIEIIHFNLYTIFSGINVCRKSLEQDFDEKVNLPDADTDAGDAGQTSVADDQVNNRMQRLNLYFEKENVGTFSLALLIRICKFVHFHFSPEG